MNTTTLYALVLHLAAVVCLTVLMAVGQLTTAVGMPLLGAAVGFSLGLPVTPPSKPGG